MIISPLEQFSILPLCGFSFSGISNATAIYAQVLLLFSTNSFITEFFNILPFSFDFTWDYYRLILGYLQSQNQIMTNVTEVSTGFMSVDSGFIGIYLFFVECLLEIWTFIYSYTLGFLFNLSTKDFSYLLLSANTSTIWLTFGVLSLTFLFACITKTSSSLIPKSSWQAALEMIYGVILGVVNENAGVKQIKHFPLIFTIFMIVLICNLLGMIPYSFTVTSHLIVTFSTALAGFIGLNIIGIAKNRRHFLSLFFPPGAPMGLAPLLVFIELVSYVFRVLSLSIRLFANLMSGHTLLKILSSFAWGAVSFWGIYLVPLAIIFLVTGLELGIACIQAYIFSVLLCIYINDAYNLH